MLFLDLIQVEPSLQGRKDGGREGGREGRREEGGIGLVGPRTKVAVHELRSSIKKCRYLAG